MYMSFILDPKNREHFIMKRELPDNLSEDEIREHSKRQVTEYYYHSMLYATDNVLVALKKFIKESNRHNFLVAAKAMRQGLWNKRTKLNPNDMILE